LALAPANKSTPLVQSILNDAFSGASITFDLNIKGREVNVEMDLPFSMIVPALKLKPL
jgi:hypothetical protein